MDSVKIRELVALVDELENCGCGGTCASCASSGEVFEFLSEEDKEEIDAILTDASTRSVYRAATPQKKGE